MNRTIKPFRITIILDDAKPVAQVESMERITEDDGTLITARALPAESLTFPLGDEIIGAVSTAALAKVAELESVIKSDKEAADKALADAKADAAAKLAEVAAAHSLAMEEAQKTISESAPALQAAQAEIEALKNKVIELTPKPDSLQSVIERMDAYFTANVPKELEPLFIDAYAVVRALVGFGKIDYAKTKIGMIELPAELEPFRAGLLQLLPQ